MTERAHKTKSNEKILRFLKIEGIIFLIIGPIAFLWPALTADSIGNILNADFVKYVGLILIFIGFINLAIVPKILRTNNKSNQK
jgi:uncharacterized membrane protein HdeD (DUF308 family)